MLYDHFEALALNVPREFKVALAMAIKYWKDDQDFLRRITSYLEDRESELVHIIMAAAEAMTAIKYILFRVTNFVIDFIQSDYDISSTQESC